MTSFWSALVQSFADLTNITPTAGSFSRSYRRAVAERLRQAMRGVR